MPLEFFKNWLFENELKKEIEITKDNGSSIGIYIPYIDNLSQIDAIRNFIVTHGTKMEDIHFLSFANQNVPLLSPSIPVYTLKDINWYGVPKNKIALDFISRKYKRFYYLFPTYTSHQKFIVSKIKADFKAGIYSRGIESKLDLTLDNKFSAPLESLKEIYSTIMKLRSKNNDSI